MSCRFYVVNCRRGVLNVSCRLWVTGYRLQGTGYMEQVARNKLQGDGVMSLRDGDISTMCIGIVLMYRGTFKEYRGIVERFGGIS